jgi:hypothetical protein
MLDPGFHERTEAFAERIPCAQCGAAIVAPTWSEHVNECRIRRFWECEACGYEFETIVYLRARAA